MSDKEVVSVTTWASSRWRFSTWANVGFPRIRPVAWGILPPVGTFSFPVAQRLLYASKPLDDAVFADRQAPTLINCQDTANQCPVIGHSGQATVSSERQVSRGQRTLGPTWHRTSGPNRANANCRPQAERQVARFAPPKPAFNGVKPSYGRKSLASAPRPPSAA